MSTKWNLLTILSLFVVCAFLLGGCEVDDCPDDSSAESEETAAEDGEEASEGTASEDCDVDEAAAAASQLTDECSNYVACCAQAIVSSDTTGQETQESAEQTCEISATGATDDGGLENDPAACEAAEADMVSLGSCT